MKNPEPKEIARARDLLKKFEATKGHQDRLRCFEDAMEALDECAGDHDLDESIRRLASNMKRTYIRKLLETLPDPETLDLYEWFLYILPLILKLRDDVDSICREHSILGSNFKNFVTWRGDEVLELLQTHAAKQKSAELKE